MSEVMLDKNGKPRHVSGLKVGQKHSGQFKAGHDPRRRKHDEQVAAFRREFTAKLAESSNDVAQFLLDTMRDPSTPPKVRLNAANNIMDRILGKPVAYAAVAVQGDTAGISQKDIGTLSDTAILQLLEQSGTIAPLSSVNTAIDGEFTESAPEPIQRGRVDPSPSEQGETPYKNTNVDNPSNSALSPNEHVYTQSLDSPDIGQADTPPTRETRRERHARLIKERDA